MLTIDLERLGVGRGDRVLDLGCGAGRHSLELYRRGVHVVALDHDGGEVAATAGWLAAMEEGGETPVATAAHPVVADAYRLPFGDGAFDAVVAAEILEHLDDDVDAMGEIVRVVRPGGRVAVSVPRYGPERVCWALSDAYHEVEGGHVRIYRRRQLLGRLRSSGLRPTGTGHAHALHSPYWWLRCLLGTGREDALPVRLYHRLLVWDLERRPWVTRTAERLLDPVIGKSVVVYLTKPGGSRAAA